ncbi:MAG TPA: aminomethyltransferase family protein [Pyrinomonadaceae bacterium]|nr:aminomethyltransferase family protein [Pyrinomonadaceae bacterium]
MTEATEHLTVHKSPLDETHEGLGATMREGVPASYGDAAAEYATVRGGGAGLSDLSARGRIEVCGSEAVPFLNGLVTNDVKALAEGAWMTAAFPNAQGRLVALTRVLRLGQDRFLFDTEAVARERVLKTLGRFTLAGDFRVRDLTDETALVTVQGARSAEILRTALGPGAAETARGLVHTEGEWGGRPLYVMRATHTAEDGFDLIVGGASAPSLWAALSAAGARPVGADALEVLRVEAGVARHGVDMDETNVVLEAAPDDAVSFTKGCYIGQEIIARIHWRGHVAKRLAGLAFDARADAKRDDKVTTPDGQVIGRLTSVAFSPALNRTVALAYVKYDYLAPGTEVRVVGGGTQTTARVASLPFVRGSWHGAAEAGA